MCGLRQANLRTELVYNFRMIMQGAGRHRGPGRRKNRYLVAALTVALLLSACTTGVQQASSPSTAAPAAVGGPLDLRGVCPSTIVIQTDWDPNAENFGALYGLLG